jgi:hypothetical protein
LQAIANVVPVTYSLTTHDSCFTITTNRLLSFLEKTRNEDVGMGETDISKQVATAGLLAWLDVTLPHQTGERWFSHLSGLMMKRRELGLPTVFLATGPMKTNPEEKVELILDKTATTLGKTIAMMMEEIAVFRFFNQERKDVDVKTFKV